MPFKTHSPEVRASAVRMVLDRLSEYPSVTAASRDLAPKLGVGVDTLRKWVAQAQTDAGARPGVKSEEIEQIKTLKREVRDLRETNEILKAASIFFARELDPRHRS